MISASIECGRLSGVAWEMVARRTKNVGRKI